MRGAGVGRRVEVESQEELGAHPGEQTESVAKKSGAVHPGEGSWWIGVGKE